jgi:hypothetical protein
MKAKPRLSIVNGAKSGRFEIEVASEEQVRPLTLLFRVRRSHRACPDFLEYNRMFWASCTGSSAGPMSPPSAGQ